LLRRHHRHVDEPRISSRSLTWSSNEYPQWLACVQNEEHDVGGVDDGADRLPLDRVPLVCRPFETPGVSMNGHAGVSRYRGGDDDPLVVNG
jgi:hypothetical protein